MADFTTTGASNRTTFANAKAWEVVVEHELLGVLVHQAIDALLVTTGTQCHCDQRLGFATLEQRRTVNARNQVGFALDRAKSFSISTIGSNASQNRIANDSLFQVMNRSAQCFRADCAVGVCVRDHVSFDLILDRVLGGSTIVLAGDEDRVFVLVVVLRLQLVQQAIVCRRLKFDFLNRELLSQLFLQINNLLTNGVSELDRGQHVSFRHFTSETFDHGDFRFGSRNDDVHVAIFQLLKCWEADKLSVYPSDSR